MKRHIAWSSLLVLALSVPVVTEAQTTLRDQLGIRRPAAPRVVYTEQPRMRVIPGTSVYMPVDRRADYDFFRYGDRYYIFHDGHWYSARAYRGPFAYVDGRYVPRPIFNTPTRYWKHHWSRHPHGGPPGLMKKGGMPPGQAKKHGKGHGKGRG